VYNLRPVDEIFNLNKKYELKLYKKNAKLAPLKLKINGINLIEVSINSASNK
jgi:hypothetical protein